MNVTFKILLNADGSYGLKQREQIYFITLPQRRRQEVRSDFFLKRDHERPVQIPKLRGGKRHRRGSPKPPDGSIEELFDCSRPLPQHRIYHQGRTDFGGDGGCDGGCGSCEGSCGGSWGDSGSFNADPFSAGNFDVSQSLAFDAMMGGMPGVATGPGEWAGWGSWATQDAAGNWTTNDITGNFAGMNAQNPLSTLQAFDAPAYNAGTAFNTPEVTGGFGANYGAGLANNTGGFFGGNYGVADNTAGGGFFGGNYGVADNSYGGNYGGSYGYSAGAAFGPDSEGPDNEGPDNEGPDYSSNYSADPVGLDPDVEAPSFSTPDEDEPDDPEAHGILEESPRDIEKDTSRTVEEPETKDEYTPSAQQSRDVQNIISRDVDVTPASKGAPQDEPQEEKSTDTRGTGAYRGPTTADDPLYSQDPYADVPPEEAKNEPPSTPPDYTGAPYTSPNELTGGPTSTPTGPGNINTPAGPGASIGPGTSGGAPGTYPGGGGYPGGSFFAPSEAPSGVPSISVGPDPSGGFPGFAGNAPSYTGPFSGPDVVGDRGNLSIPGIFLGDQGKDQQQFEAPSRGPLQVPLLGNIPSKGGPSNQGPITGLQGNLSFMGPQGQPGGTTPQSAPSASALGQLLSSIGNLFAPSAQAAVPSVPGGRADEDIPPTPDIPFPFTRSRSRDQRGRQGRQGRAGRTGRSGRAGRSAESFASRSAQAASRAQAEADARSQRGPVNGVPNYGPQDRSNKNIPASQRYNNPGAAWPRDSLARGTAPGTYPPSGRNTLDARFGMTDRAVLSDNARNQIAGFPTTVHGLAYNIALAQQNYVGKTVSQAMTLWSGGHRSDVGPGSPYKGSDVLTSQMLQDPAFWEAMGKAESGRNAPSVAQILEALAMVKAGSAANYEAQNPNAPATLSAQQFRGEAFTTQQLAGMEEGQQGRAGELGPPAVAVEPPAIAPPTQDLPPAPPSNPPFISVPLFGTPDYGQNYGPGVYETGPYNTPEADYGYNYGAGPEHVGALAPGWTSGVFGGVPQADFPAGPQFEGREADYGTNYGPGPPAVVGPYNMDIDPGGLQGAQRGTDWQAALDEAARGEQGRAGVQMPADMRGPGFTTFTGREAAPGIPSGWLASQQQQGVPQADFPAAETPTGMDLEFNPFGETPHGMDLEFDPFGGASDLGRAGDPATASIPGAIGTQAGVAAQQTGAPAEAAAAAAQAAAEAAARGASPDQIANAAAVAALMNGATPAQAEAAAQAALNGTAQFSGTGMTSFQGQQFAPVDIPGMTSFQGQQFAPVDIPGMTSFQGQQFAPTDVPGFTQFTGQTAAPVDIPGMTSFQGQQFAPVDVPGFTQFTGQEFAPVTGPGMTSFQGAPAAQEADPFAFGPTGEFGRETPQEADPFAFGPTGEFGPATETLQEADPFAFGPTGEFDRGPEEVSAPPGWLAAQQTQGVLQGTFGRGPTQAQIQSALRGPPDFARNAQQLLSQVPQEHLAKTTEMLNSLTPQEKAAIVSGRTALIDVIAAKNGMTRGQLEFAMTIAGYKDAIAAIGRANEVLAAPNYGGRTGFTAPSIDIADRSGVTTGFPEEATPVTAEPPSVAPPVQDLPPAPPAEIPNVTPPAPPSTPQVTPEPPSVEPPSVPPTAVPDAREAARSDPQTANQIIANNPQAVTNIANSYGVDMATAAMLLVFLWMNGMGEQRKQPWEMAEGGRVDERQYYVPQGSRGDDWGRWPRAPTPDYPGKVAGYGREITRRQYDAQRASAAIAQMIEEQRLRVNAQNWERFLRETPRSTHIEDRRTYDPTKDETLGAGYESGGRLPFIDRGYEEGGNVSDENYDYDMDAWRRANPGVKVEPGQHYPDTYKKPNHPTFSDESIYHNDENQGGHWAQNPDGTYSFTPGATNLRYHSLQELQDYFRRVEPGNTLNIEDRRMWGEGYEDGGGVLGYKIRNKLYPGEDEYFRTNPHVSGMAAETGDIILNPYSSKEVNRNAVAKNEALRLYMRERGIVPNFPLTDEQRRAFVGTAYGQDDDALRATIAARIYSGDPSAQQTPEQKRWVEDMVRGLPSIEEEPGWR